MVAKRRPENDKNIGDTAGNETEKKKTFDIERKTLDFTAMWGPDLPFNTYTHAPEPLEND